MNTNSPNVWEGMISRERAHDKEKHLIDDGTNVGFNSIPTRYASKDRETIDIIRDVLGDEGFAAFCMGCAIKYHERAGAKGDTSGDRAKAEWYEMMYRHVKTGSPDPRQYRNGFEPYQRQAPPKYMEEKL